MDNFADQCEEIEALNSIYDNWNVEGTTNSYSIEVAPNVKLFVTLIPSYPSNSPPIFEFLAPTLDSKQKQYISEEFQRIYQDNMGGPIIYQWIEKLKEITSGNQTISNHSPSQSVSKDIIIVPKSEINLQIIHGDIIQDRKSVFQGHAAQVLSQEDTKIFLNYLMENKKISQATHNISAYRILSPTGTLLQDCDDDGETHAGSRVLHLLQILNVTNVMVVISRWYGGIHLGPDRFKHINNAARQVLVQGGFLQQ